MSEKNWPPVYRQTYRYAEEHGELDQYKVSMDVNKKCQESIDAALRANFDGWRLKSGAIDPVIEEFGEDRVSFILACTLQMDMFDGRYSPDNKAWSASFQIPEDRDAFGFDRRRDYAVKSHPAVLNGVITLARKAFRYRAPAQTIGNRKKSSAAKER